MVNPTAGAPRPQQRKLTESILFGLQMSILIGIGVIVIYWGEGRGWGMLVGPT